MYNFFKRFFDLFISLILLLLLSPILILVIIILIIQNNGNPFFLQERGGENNNVFNIIKFKTMNDKKDEDGNLLSDDIRLTNAGSFMRKTSLDELPQLINVIKGEMSLIGPRPFMSEYLEIYSEHQKKRHNVKPGITGWAQVNGRNNLSWSEKFELDIWYVENKSLSLDMKILFITLKKVLRPKDINKKGETTTVKFNGKN